MEAVEKKVAEENAEEGAEENAEEGAAEVEIEADLGELLRAASKNDIRLKLVSNSGESQATATVNSQDEGRESKRWVAIGVVSVFVIVVFVAWTLTYYPRYGFTIVLGATGGVFASIINAMLYMSKAIERIHPNRNE